MGNKSLKRERLSIDVLSDEHRKIKIYAALHGKTIREYVLEIVRERLQHETEYVQMIDMTTMPSPLLEELWDNDKDSAYDKI